MLRRALLREAWPSGESHCKEALLARGAANVSASFQSRSHIIGAARPPPRRLRPKILFLKEKIGARGALAGGALAVAARALACSAHA